MFWTLVSNDDINPGSVGCQHHDCPARVGSPRCASAGVAGQEVLALTIDRQEGRSLAHSLSLVTDPVTVRDGDFTFESTVAQTMVRIVMDDVPRRLKAGSGVARRFFEEQRRR